MYGKKILLKCEMSEELPLKIGTRMPGTQHFHLYCTGYSSQSNKTNESTGKNSAAITASVMIVYLENTKMLWVHYQI